MKDDVRIRLRMAQLQPGQSAEFSTRVFSPILPQYDENGENVASIDRLFVNDLLQFGVAYNTGRNEYGLQMPCYQVAEDAAIRSLGREIVSAERQLQDECRPQRVHYATQKIERRFSTAMSSEIKGVHSTLSITVYRVK